MLAKNLAGALEKRRFYKKQVDMEKVNRVFFNMFRYKPPLTGTDNGKELI